MNDLLKKEFLIFVEKVENKLNYFCFHSICIDLSFKYDQNFGNFTYIVCASFHYDSEPSDFELESESLEELLEYCFLEIKNQYQFIKNEFSDC